jgi:hypothetical protein
MTFSEGSAMKKPPKTSGRTRQGNSRKSSTAAPFHWEFQVRSYRVVAEFGVNPLPAYQPSLTVIGLSAERNGPTAGQPNAVAYFHWPGKAFPARPSPVHNNTLELHYPIGSLGAIMQLLRGKQAVFCYYDADPADPLGPRAGLMQKQFNPI